ncbi:beta-sarcoglycan [Periplaneta americana]|uniref:beta-sarcoglycan n=1 Tax=Periplaneta americana TaxID=6978 RepID=UPI0037E75D6D
MKEMSTAPDSRASPMSDVASESGFTTLSLRDKALIKRNINRHHNNNFRAGYVPVHEQSLHKTGLRGRKTYAFWTLVMLLFFLALGNLLLTFIILGVLRLGQGMESLELVPEKKLVMFYGNTDLDRIYKRDGKLEGFYECPVEMTGDNGSVAINLVDNDGRVIDPKINVDLNSTTVTGVQSFDVRDPLTGHSVFSTGFPNFGLPRGVNKLDIKMAQTRRITSPVNSSLYLRSDTYTRLRGTEGTRMEGREIVWSADQDIYLKSVNGSVILSGREGISVDIKSIPIASGDSDGANPTSVQYKVCVCMPGGKLFRVPVPTHGSNKHVGCHNVDLSPHSNPCI